MSKFVLAGLLFCLLGCGVKGDPVPPDRPVEIGRGRPTYKRAFKHVNINDFKDESAKDEETKDESDEEKTNKEN